jgi:hypothetical protein
MHSAIYFALRGYSEDILSQSSDYSRVDTGGQFVARFSRPFRPENLGRVERTSDMKLVRIYLKRS